MNPTEQDASTATGPSLGSATYEILRQRLQGLGSTMRERVSLLDARRREVFGSVESRILQADRITTAHNCVPRDMVQLGHGRFLFGFNVHFGLKKEIELSDVFAVFDRDEAAGTFRDADLAPLEDPRFIGDFKRLYNIYEKTVFTKFSLIEGRLYMVFQIGAGPGDISVFKWAMEGETLRYIDGRAESEFRRVGFPPAHQFRWSTPGRESFRYGDHPHISIEDRVFVECVGGDLTIKVEDNTDTGEGVYSEPVEDRHQKVDDAEIAYARINHLVLLKIRPYKETVPRHFIFNEKLQSVERVDSIGDSCALLPEDHGLIFPDGYYLATGELKRFEARETGMTLERVVHSPNGEDSLFVFYSSRSGTRVLMPYRLIPQRVDERIVCHGFSLFPDGRLLLFRAEGEPQKHHTVQLRQTPFHIKGHEPPGNRDAYLYQIGNRDVVRCLAECNEVLSLISRENPYAELYADIVKRCNVILDAYPWLGSEDGFQLDAALRDVREAADKAVEEFDNVRRLQREAASRFEEMRRRCDEQFAALRRASLNKLDEFVVHLTALRHLRGELIALRDVRHVDPATVSELEEAVAAKGDELADACVRFLLSPESLEPYRQRAAAQLAAADDVTTVAQGRALEKDLSEMGAGLEMLIEIVNSLRIEDATQTTRILDGITAIYTTLNQTRAALQKRLQSLTAAEGAARFSAQMKLLGQSAASFLDLCDTPEKCEEYLNRVGVQLEELEGAFAEFEEYAVQIAERRTELYEAFEQRKIALVEKRNRRAAALMTSAERILKVIRNRLAGFEQVEEIHAYMASDLMVARVRETIDQLLQLGDPIRADDLTGRLKSAQQEAIGQLKDRIELFSGGDHAIQLGRHRFNVNTQPLDLTIVHSEGVPCFHLTGTRYFEPITDPEFLASADLMGQELVSENSLVYRAEYLAHCLFQSLLDSDAGRPAGASPDSSAEPTRRPADLAAALALSEADRMAWIHEFMSPRYQEGYSKGVHDVDAARIFTALAETHIALQSARYPPAARSCAIVYWHRFAPDEVRRLWTARLMAFAERNRLFPGDPIQRTCIDALARLLTAFISETHLYPADTAAQAAEYLFHELTGPGGFRISREADQLVTAFTRHLDLRGSRPAYDKGLQELQDHPVSAFELVRDWVRGFLLDRPSEQPWLQESAAFLFCEDAPRVVVDASSSRILSDMRGLHPRIRDGQYDFDYLEMQSRLRRFTTESVPRFTAFQRLKQDLLARERARLRLEQFQPRPLTTFVRNELIDRVYLPLIGENLARQIGAAGDARRTDLMGLLLLISPPGYGKTTLMEYVASRLGIVFIKINGPALGHGVTSLDPEEAPNASAREEIQRLNLAMEMGDNAMICIDDIQHCHPEFLQKFISLCDAQRKIEGVWRGRPRTYDLRGRKVVVVMAGNPYTESGQRFRLPDMLANRADTYNLGDILTGSMEWFKASYLENAVTSNPVLAPLAMRSQKDVRAFIRLAASGETQVAGLEGSYSPHEVNEILSVMRKLAAIRDVVLRVNGEYIHSAAQADEYRTEPPFRLQGSYRNMNRLAEKVVPVMNDEEIQAILLDHYRSEAQTLTTGAESNFLKFKELIGIQTPEDQARWEEIKKTFRRNLLTRGGDQDPVGRVVAQLSAFHAGLESIQQTLQTQLSRSQGIEPAGFTALAQSLRTLGETLRERLTPTPDSDRSSLDAAHSVTRQLADGLGALREEIARAISAAQTGPVSARMQSLSHELEMIHSTLATLKDLARQQRDHLREARELLAARARQGTVEFELTQEMLANERAFLDRFHEVLAHAQRTREAAEAADPSPDQAQGERDHTTP